MLKGIIKKMRETHIDVDKLQKVSESREVARANVYHSHQGTSNMNLR